MSKKTLVIGASLKTDRYSNMAIRQLVANHHEVIAIGMQIGYVSEVEIKTDFQDVLDIHTITLYLNPKRQEPYYDYIIKLNPKRVIFNPGTENHEFFDMLKKKNIAVEESCTLVLLSTNQY